MTAREYVESLSKQAAHEPLLEFVTVRGRLPVGHTFSHKGVAYTVTSWQYETPRLPGYFVVALAK
jgi:hypothetical protein